jgi:branched-chain amino acid transport system permease protein
MKGIVKWIGGPLLLGIALIVAKIVFPGKITFFTEVAIFTLYVMGCNLLYGYLGMVSFGQPFYLGVGAYATAIYLAYFGTDLVVSIGVGIGAGVAIGVLLGPFFIRLRGDYFALVNMATCAIGLFVVEKLLLPITRGDDGLWYRSRMAETLILDIRKADHFFFFVLLVLFLVLILFKYMDQSVLGVSFQAVKVNERRMRFLGYSTFKIKWIGFTLASVLSSLAGALFAINFGFVNPNLGHPHRAADVLVATLLGGSGTLYGPFFGSLAFLGMRDVVSKYVVRWELLVGVITIVVVFKFGRGIWGTIEQFVNEKLKDQGPQILEEHNPVCKIPNEKGH